MNVFEVVYGRINGFGYPVYDTLALQGVDPPYAVMSKISSLENWTLQGTTDLLQTRIQIDCYAIDIAQARDMFEQIRAALNVQGPDIYCGEVSQTGDFPELTLEASRVSGDFSLNHQRVM